MENLNVNQEMNFEEMVSVVWGRNYSLEDCNNMVDYGLAMIDTVRYLYSIGEDDQGNATLGLVSTLIDELDANC